MAYGKPTLASLTQNVAENRLRASSRSVPNSLGPQAAICFESHRIPYSDLLVDGLAGAIPRPGMTGGTCMILDLFPSAGLVYAAYGVST